MTAPTDQPVHLSDRIRAFLDDTRFATIATVDADGAPHQAVIWYALADDTLVLNSAVGRRWPTNLVRDGRISVAVTDAVDSYRWVGLNGRVEVVEDQPTAQADIAGMARRYHADEPAKAEAMIRDRFERQTRISFRIQIETIHDELD